MQIQVEMTQADLEKLIIEHLSEILNVTLTVKDVCIQVKSKQNYKSEWEQAIFRAIVNKS